MITGGEKKKNEVNLWYKKEKVGKTKETQNEKKKKNNLETYGDARAKEIDGPTEGFYYGTQFDLDRDVVENSLLR